jgi:hypothetical protein
MRDTFLAFFETPFHLVSFGDIGTNPPAPAQPPRDVTFLIFQ